MTAQFEKRSVRSRMRVNGNDYVDSATGEINSTRLAEAAAHVFDKGDVGGPLDDPDHWIWELALEGRST